MQTNTEAIVIIGACSLTGLAYGVLNYLRIHHKYAKDYNNSLYKDDLLFQMGDRVAANAMSHIHDELSYLVIALLFFALFIHILAEHPLYDFAIMAAYTLGAFLSLISEFLGMHLAVMSNIQTASKARKSIEYAFTMAFQGASSTGFVALSLFLVGNTVTVLLYGSEKAFSGTAGYAAGATTVALLSRIGGGIFAKAADVGADLAGKSYKLEEDDIRNPGVIADIVGDNVGDVTGVCSDLLSSLSACTCAAIVLGTSPLNISPYFSLLVLSCALIAALIVIIVSFLLTHGETQKEIEQFLKCHYFIGIIVMTPLLLLVLPNFLPNTIVIDGTNRTPFDVFLCVIAGLVGGYVISIASEYLTSKEYYPVQEIAKSCHTGSVIDIIYGLALGQFSTVSSVLVVATVIYVSCNLLGTFGLAIASVGMLSLSQIVAIGFLVSPIADNAIGLAQMANEMETRKRVKELHFAAKTVKARERTYSLACSALTSLSIIAAFFARSNSDFVDMLNPTEMTGLLVGFMIPYGFSAEILRAVNFATLKVAEEIKEQLPGIMEGRKDADYEECVETCTGASLSAMIVPTIIAVLVPVIAGIVLGPLGMAGILIGVVISGIQVGTSAVNSGVAWDNAMKLIEENEVAEKTKEKYMREERKVVEQVRGKFSEAHYAALIGDQVGDPMKASLGPAIGIFMKQTCMIALLLGSTFAQTGFLRKFI